MPAGPVLVARAWRCTGDAQLPYQNAQEIPNALEPTPIATLRRRALQRVAVSTLTILLVLTGFEVGVHMVAADAMQVTASAAASGQTLATATVTNRHTIADLYTYINSLPSDSLFSNCSALPSPGAVTFEVLFMRWGLPVEDATLPGIGCGLWDVSQGGLPSVRDPDSQTQAILTELRTLRPAFTPPQAQDTGLCSARAPHCRATQRPARG